PPVAASITTAYCVLSVSWAIERGSMRTASSGSRSAITCVWTRVPSENRYHFMVANGAPVDWTMIGVVHPFGPPRVRVTFGRYRVRANSLVALAPIAVEALRVAPTTANLPPDTNADQSPSVISAAVAASHEKTAPGARDGPITWAASDVSPCRRRNIL